MLVRKAYVGVLARIDTEGQLTPLEIMWEDGTRYTIDRVLDVHRAVSQMTGGIGVRYTCRIGGRETYLFYEDVFGKWFMEEL